MKQNIIDILRELSTLINELADELERDEADCDTYLITPSISVHVAAQSYNQQKHGHLTNLSFGWNAPILTAIRM